MKKYKILILLLLLNACTIIPNNNYQYQPYYSDSYYQPYYYYPYKLNAQQKYNIRLNMLLQHTR